MTATSSEIRPRVAWGGLARVGAVLAAELFCIHYARHFFGFECYTERYAGFCGVARDALLASYAVGAAFVILGLFAPAAWRDLLRAADLRPLPLLANLAGLAILLATLPFLRMTLTPVAVAAIGALWAVAAGMVLAGAMLMIAPPARWKALYRSMGWPLPLAIAASAAAPFAAIQARPFWNDEVLAGYTFSIVTWLLELSGQSIEAWPEDRIMGAGGFYVDIAPGCSGIEGIVLTSVFVLIYLSLFRREMRFPNALLLLPLAVAISWALNSVRIAVLVQIGIAGFPGLAVGGFHSHAGWLMFTLLSLGIVLVSQAVPFFHRKPAGAAPAAGRPQPFLEDPAVARILPFIVFMATALLASTFSAQPALVYPLRMLAMAAVLWLVWPHLRALPWRLDPLATGTGAFIAVYWVATGPAADGAPPPFGDLAGPLLVAWIAARVLGTTLLVPVIEELFFRGYMMDRLAPEGAAPWRAAAAIVLTSALFAALHDRWIAAAVAGVLFALLVLRSRNLTDAIVAHAAANGLIAAWAISTGDWSVI